MPSHKKVNIFIDSGAFSAWSKGVDINIYDYIKFIKRNSKYINVYSVLDSIGDPQRTLDNQKKMEEHGLTPIPCFHYGEDVSFLSYYIENYDYISLGGMVPIHSNDLVKWLDYLFSEFICDDDGMPIVKVHGFGMTSLKLMRRYPWYSVDSTSWVMTSRFGSVLVPRSKGGKYDYTRDAYKVSISARPGSSSLEDGIDYSNLDVNKKKYIDKYFSIKGFVVGKSTFRWRDLDYNLGDNERWSGKKKGGRRLVETVEIPGLCNDYKQRDRLNIIYFMDLEKSFPRWPYPFKHNKRVGFGLS